ncbi:MAG TPA: hypothetical protein VGR92_09835 [Steroidobacteraceae bacterium]|nr:hypothetical protein [Steroidobacteraceae bacterium]
MTSDADEFGRVSRREVNAALMSSIVAAAVAPKIAGAGNSTGQGGAASAAPPLVHERPWQLGDTDESTHVLGNGRAVVHEQGPNIIFFRAPWISSPNLLTLSLAGPDRIRTLSSREEGTNIWHHRLYVGADAVGEIVDFLEEGEPCFRRVISSRVELVFSLRSPRLVDYSERYPNRRSVLGQWPCGTYIYGDFRARDPFTVQLVLPPGVQIQSDAQAVQPKRWLDWRELQSHGWVDLPHHLTQLRVPPGDGEMLIAADADVSGCLEAIERAVARPTEQTLTVTRRAWRLRRAKAKWAGPDNDTSLPVESVIDDVATLLLGYRSQAGGFAAGPWFPLFYVRDQYGISRALLSLQMLDEARANLAYYHSVWMAHGRIHNAQTDGAQHWFHRAENDDVEITGYLIIQAFDYLAASRDDDFIAQILPMLEWALVAQERQLLGNMLPFNGDETYVAGGMFPRTHLDDGSSEATLLYLTAATRLLGWTAARKLWPAQKVLRHQQTLAAVRRDYARNFAASGTLAINNPKRRDLGPLPRFRYGVCLGQYDDNCLFLATTELAKDERYFCYSCYPKRTREVYEPRRYFIPSVALVSSLIGHTAVSKEVMTATLTAALGEFSHNGRFSWPQRRLPGYETAILSLALLERRHPRTHEFIDNMLTMRDSTGTWDEYYLGKTPQGTRCRPWESSLSLLALLDYVAAPRVA